jgi:hypothetical protein
MGSFNPIIFFSGLRAAADLFRVRALVFGALTLAWADHGVAKASNQCPSIV